MNGSPIGEEDAACDVQQSDTVQDNRDEEHSVLSTQYSVLAPAHLPQPTYWPVVLALGVVFIAWGVVTTVAISVIGLALLALALGGWIGELRHGDG